MKFHVEGLSKKQLAVLHKLAPAIQPNDFYLESLKLTSVAIAVEGKMGLEVKITHSENAIQ